ncbi:hypothetical protein JB92DRAFT_3052448 [Gautieria morchelliformis]|nr:hypothetical protein JB92DRAFT_3052448 [Gautieria morchelliformis]
MFGFGKLYKSPAEAVNEGSHYDTPVRRRRRRSMLRKKVVKLAASTKSLFNRSKAKKEDKILQESALADAYKSFEMGEPVFVPGVASLEGPSRLPYVEDLDSGPLPAAFTSRPEDNDDDLLLILATSAVDILRRDDSEGWGEDLIPSPQITFSQPKTLPIAMRSDDLPRDSSTEQEVIHSVQPEPRTSHRQESLDESLVQLPELSEEQILLSQAGVEVEIVDNHDTSTLSGESSPSPHPQPQGPLSEPPGHSSDVPDVPTDYGLVAPEHPQGGEQSLPGGDEEGVDPGPQSEARVENQVTQDGPLIDPDVLNPKPNTSKLELTGHQSSEIPKVVPTSPSPSEASSYLSGSNPYAIAMFALAVGFCAVAAPQIYRLLRTR